MIEDNLKIVERFDFPSSGLGKRKITEQGDRARILKSKTSLSSETTLERRLVQVEGKPVSETIIEERR